METAITITFDCGHENTYRITARGDDPPRQAMSVKALCPSCEAEADRLSCSACGQSHRPEDLVITPANLAYGKDCLLQPA